ncbi:MAG TPA: hypothetical protein EYQ53_06880 [Candidatus Poseidoniales archaeon]|nr:hypothetical protein [Candidatus Poseidoniales archaeon]HIK78666.1 hypothetical protein [Candidatus Poseidoniales archaeon]
MMFNEEWRQNVDFARKRHILLFPALLSVVTMVVTIGLRFLVGEGVTNDAVLVEETRRAFTWQEMRFALHFPLFMFSLGMGSFAFLGRVMVSQRASGLNYLLTAPALQPLSQSTNYFTYYIKEVTFYVMLVLSPVAFGMALGILLGNFVALPTPLLYSSLPITIIAMILSLAQGLAFSFFGSALWTRGKIWGKVVPLMVIGIAVLFAMGHIPAEYMVFGYALQSNHNWWLIPIGFGLTIGLALLGAFITSNDFEQAVIERKEIFGTVYGRLGFLGNGKMRLLVTKELVDLLRSGTIKKMIVSYSVPLIVLLMLAWLVDFAEMPIPINLLSYAPFLGFFGFNFYSWLTGIDSPEHMNGLPMRVPDLIKAKVIVYFLTTTWISILFLLLMSWSLDAWAALPVALVIMLANSIYIVSLTAFLMGLRPNKAIFDASIMIYFWIGTVIPLLVLFLLSFTQGDAAFYDNWASAIYEQGIDSSNVGFDDEKAKSGFGGILGVSTLLLFASWLLMRLLDRKWGSAEFSN